MTASEHQIEKNLWIPPNKNNCTKPNIFSEKRCSYDIGHPLPCINGLFVYDATCDEVENPNSILLLHVLDKEMRRKFYVKGRIHPRTYDLVDEFRVASSNYHIVPVHDLLSSFA